MELTIEDLSYEIKQKKIISHINLSFTSGTLYGILGPNGSGKSTLLNLIAGIWKPSSGKILWNHRNLLSLPRSEISKTITLVPQSPHVHFDFTVEEMVSMGQYSQRNRDKNLIASSIDATDVTHLRHRPITHLSVGERQRVYIARSLASGTPIILLDEPTANLDIHHQLAIWKLLRTLVADGKIVIVTVHDLIAAERFCDQVTILNQGQCISQGSFKQATSNNVLENIFKVKKEDLIYNK